ncbi:glycoside hydrolase, partial [Aureobasidium subglaciale]
LGFRCNARTNASQSLVPKSLDIPLLSIWLTLCKGGSWAEVPGTTCPLNTCCSAYGFCGTTDDFCDASAGCQSNCGTDPPLPAGGNSGSSLNRVIGYYEAWSDRRECHSFPPSALPVDGLTHVNFAFAYIDPSSLKVTTMDSATPQELFTQTTNIRQLKSGNSQLEVFISIGGWTFSDNGTATQDVFPSIAADESKRQKFADNLVSFMKEYGFDGFVANDFTDSEQVDLDWEYPGAPDRGGRKDDTKNYVLLMKTLRETFRASERGNYGLTFTIPSSYWYLRWFDLPGMVEYVDWINLMSYDLHGVWDRNNPIGSIVQAHTNLTEIKLSTDLLWRVDVPPGKVVLGIGFYGRAFQLKDAKCSKVGCQFKGAANEGPCTKAAGTLGYFEIMDILNDQKPDVQYDKTAGVKYFAYGDNKDQWISYDDKETFKQKVDFADDKQLGGLMIWAVDLDDDDFTALSGLVGKSLPNMKTQLKKVELTDQGHWSSQNGQKCIMSDCEDESHNPPPGYGYAPNGGAFKDNCGGGKNKYIYCPLDAMPSSCEWRGSGSCHGQCHAGETTLFHSKHGSKKCLAPGQQAFCCVSNTWSNLVENCAWNGEDQNCPSDKPNDISWRWNKYSSCAGGPPCVIKRYKEQFCCGYAFQNCHWVGKGTCDDNECSDTDVEIVLDAQGATGSSCAGGLNGRQKPLCCNSPSAAAPFLPVPLEDLFPTLPPSDYIPVFDNPTIASGPSLVGQVNPQAFGLVVIDGPPDAVTNLRKRDGSHISFLSCDTARDHSPGIARIVCMDMSGTSNCNDMHQGGLEGTIIKLPEDCGFATYAVAHSVTPSATQVLPEDAPADATIYDLRYSYDFSLAKRDSGDIYVRIDYSDSRDYWEQAVAAKHAKRDLGKRWWSKDSQDWKDLINKLRVQADKDFNPKLSKDSFDVLIYGNDGSDKNCAGDGFLKVGLSGSISSSIKWGVTLVGTISPSFQLEEAYSYFDSNPQLSGTLSFNGKGKIDIEGGLPDEQLFSSPITNYEFSHPGIVSFKPQLQVSVELAGSGEIDGDFEVDFRHGSQATLRTNAPLSISDFGGSPAGKNPTDPFRGDVTGNGTSDGTLFGMKMIMETSLEMKLYEYNTQILNGNATLGARITHDLAVVDKGGKISVVDGDTVALGDAVQLGQISSTWTDQETHQLGSTLKPKTIKTGGSTPSERDTPEINGFALFGGRDFMECSSGSTSNPQWCNLTVLSDIDPSLAIPDDSVGSFSLQKRTSGERSFDLTVAGIVIATIFSHSYYTGGQDLLRHNPDAGMYALATNAQTGDCEWVDDGTYGNPAAEHMLELNQEPRSLEWAMGAEARLPDGRTMRTQYPAQDTRIFGAGGRYLSSWGSWDPNGNHADPSEAPVDDSFRAYGDTTNAGGMVNVPQEWNLMKTQVFQGNTPISDNLWNDRANNGANDRDSTTNIATGREAVGALQSVAGLFTYLNHDELNDHFIRAANGVRANRQNFQDRYNANLGPNDAPMVNLPEQYDEYILYVLVPTIEIGVEQWVTRRGEILIRNWTAELGRTTNAARRTQINAIIAEVRGVMGDVEDALMDMSRFDGV